MSKFGSREIATIGVMGALTYIAMVTMFPVPATSGYFSFGDAIVMITALTFGPVVGAIVGGLGSGLADFLGGWYNWVAFTAVIKGTEGYIVGILAGDPETRTFNKTVIAWFMGAIVMVTGYFIVHVFMYDLRVAMVEIPFNLIQMVVAGIVGIPVSIAVKNRRL